MGIFDRFTSKRPRPPQSPAADPTSAAGGGTPAPVPAEPAAAPSGAPAVSVKARLAQAREKLDAKDLPAALAIYEEVIGLAGERADVLVAISGDLGSHGHVSEIIELVAPRYDADRHGPATGLNLLQAYLAVRNAEAAQHVLDILFALNRPELEDRLHGFSNAIAEMIAAPDTGPLPPGGVTGGPADLPRVSLISLSKPIWFYGLEPLAAQILPPKEARLRRIAFAQLALPGYPDLAAAMKKPEDELGRLSRAIPLWFAETFYFAALYAPAAVVGLMQPAGGGVGQHVIFGNEWTTDNLRQLVDTANEEIDYIVTGALRAVAGDYDIVLRVWEVKAFRERKSFTARWTPATADAALAKLHAELRAFMEWSPASAAFAYTVPAQPRPWLETLGASLGPFLVEKSLLPAEHLPPLLPDVEHAAARAASGEAASFGFLTLRARARTLGLLSSPVDAALARSALVTQAANLLG